MGLFYLHLIMTSYADLLKELKDNSELIKKTPKQSSTKAIIRGLALRCQEIKSQMAVMGKGIFHSTDDPLLNTTDLKNNVHAQLKK